ncbi:MAG: serine/threonine-protein kinase [Botrimarina sp.]
MPSNASPADRAADRAAADVASAEDAAGQAGPADAGRSPRGSRAKAMRFQYATGDRPLEGYTIKRGVGRGGFGEVYFATSDAGKEVALKLIRRNLDVEVRGVRQCLNLKHPNLVALYDLRTDSADDQWVVMEYVAGESLEDAIARHPDGMPVEEALQWFRGVAAGVAYLHASGIVHRDLKPGNIYLERGDAPISQRVRIGDYGLSKFISTSRRSGQTESVGTVHYMAPEIAGGRYGREIDSYALGVILYEMLTGHVPFEGESVGEVLMKHLTAEPNLSRIADPYRTIVAGALAKDPENRLSSVEEMVALLPGESSPAALTPVPPPVEQEVWSPVSRPPHTDHPKPPREPLWQYAVELSDEARRWWKDLPLPPLGKGLIFFATLAMLIASGVLFVIPVTIVPMYLGWYLFWSIFLKGDTTPPAAEAAPAQLQRPKPNRRRGPLYDWRELARKERRLRSRRDKATSLTGSLLVAALAAIVLGAIAGPLLAGGTAADAMSLAVWTAAVIALGSWGVILSGAVSEALLEDHLPRRGLNLVVGLAAGCAAFGLAETMGLALPYSDDLGVEWNEVLLEEAFGLDLYPAWERGAGAGAVPLVASMAYFGLTFAVIRWWRSTDYLRRTRNGFFAVAATALAAFLAGLVTWYPQPLGMVLLAGIVCATQTASPWCPPSRRIQLARGPVHGGLYHERA